MVGWMANVKKSNQVRIILVTAPNKKVARKLARTALESRLIACANLIPALESHYWWEDKIESGSEVLLLLKTTARNLSALEKLILESHPYDTAEFVAIRPDSVTPRYLQWWLDSVS
jgi:periplasmic divalent cation tolerance protein